MVRSFFGISSAVSTSHPPLDEAAIFTCPCQDSCYFLPVRQLAYSTSFHGDQRYLLCFRKKKKSLCSVSVCLILLWFQYIRLRLLCPAVVVLVFLRRVSWLAIGPHPVYETRGSVTSPLLFIWWDKGTWGCGCNENKNEKCPFEISVSSHISEKRAARSERW